MQDQIALAPPVVLVVDDDPAVRSALKFSLEIDGFTVRTYACAQALLREADLPARGCLVLDQVMPDVSGLDLLALLRRRAVGLPAVLITTNPSARTNRRAARAGVGVVEKPLTGDDTLVDAIHAALGPSA